MSLYTVSSKSWYSGYWNTSPTWKRTSRIFLGSAQMSFPSSRICPDVGSQQAVQMLNQGGLAGAGVADDPKNSPSYTSKLMSSTALRWKGVPTP